ncbi:MAG: L,D-transpeptidase [Devosia nanyangense]|uniref:L,D-transpeptidase n=1 Tax=Devosia nanyangense TaxID=1228055 RepID=A0A933NWI8_9HYPH|nr:L,D-transpeptidase [Devosia nanyangense]
MTSAVFVPSRRSFVAGAASLAALSLAGCATSRRIDILAPSFSDYYLTMYGPLPDEKFPVPAIDPNKLDPEMFRTQVPDPTGERPGTIVVNTSERHLYLVQEGGQAIRYGVGIGREGFAWSGKAAVGRKAVWPTWTPPLEMQERQPETREWANGMPGGLANPLGARAMYIYQGGRDTLYRLHGTLEVWSIGSAVSSGCVRLLFHDIIDLYGRCPVGTPIVVNS